MMVRKFRGKFTEEMQDGGLKDCELVVMLDKDGMLVEPILIEQESYEYDIPNPSGASE